MRLSEISRLVWLNLVQNKFKVFLTSTGIIVGSATIMLVIAIGTGGKLEVAEQFKNLNAGSIDISYEYNGSGFTGGIPGGGMPGGDMGGDFPPFGGMENQMNTTKITLSQEDADNLKESIPEIASATISYTTRQEAEGGSIDRKSVV